MLKSSKTSVADSSFCKKKMVSSAYAVYGKSLSETLELLILRYFFILMNSISKSTMKRYANKGSRCLVVLFNLN